jgi:hypothetical protein
MNGHTASQPATNAATPPSAEVPMERLTFEISVSGQVGEREPAARFELLVASILSTTSEHDIRS